LNGKHPGLEQSKKPNEKVIRRAIPEVGCQASQLAADRIAPRHAGFRVLAEHTGTTTERFATTFPFSKIPPFLAGHLQVQNYKRSLVLHASEKGCNASPLTKEAALAFISSSERGLARSAVQASLFALLPINCLITHQHSTFATF
jgi:hypothetical protein